MNWIKLTIGPTIYYNNKFIYEWLYSFLKINKSLLFFSSLIQERFVISSDGILVDVCKDCGLIGYEGWYVPIFRYQSMHEKLCYKDVAIMLHLIWVTLFSCYIWWFIKTGARDVLQASIWIKWQCPMQWNFLFKKWWQWALPLACSWKNLNWLTDI